jgi:hypothetical protein
MCRVNHERSLTRINHELCKDLQVDVAWMPLLSISQAMCVWRFAKYSKGFCALKFKNPFALNFKFGKEQL